MSATPLATLEMRIYAQSTFPSVLGISSYRNEAWRTTQIAETTIAIHLHTHPRVKAFR